LTVKKLAVCLDHYTPLDCHPQFCHLPYLSMVPMLSLNSGMSWKCQIFYFTPKVPIDSQNIWKSSISQVFAWLTVRLSMLCVVWITFALQCCIVHCVSKKRPTFTTCYNFYIHSSIATIFGINVAEKVGNQNVLYFPTTPN